MSRILSVIASPDTPVRDLSSVRTLFRMAGAPRIRTLAAGIAWEGRLETASGTPMARLRQTAASACLDVNIIPAENRRKKLLVADMDSTVINQECIDELAALAGKRKEVSAITAKAMGGGLDFEDSLKARVRMLEGLPEEVLATTFRERISLRKGARTLVMTMKATGAQTALLSGGFTFFTQRVAAAAGFDHHRANTLVIRNGYLAGEVTQPVLGRDAKRIELERLTKAYHLKPEETLAAGDGANDLAMLAHAGQGVAFHAAPAVAEAAGTRIDHGDLTALLYLQGIGKDEFSTA